VAPSGRANSDVGQKKEGASAKIEEKPTVGAAAGKEGGGAETATDEEAGNIAAGVGKEEGAPDAAAKNPQKEGEEVAQKGNGNANPKGGKGNKKQHKGGKSGGKGKH